MDLTAARGGSSLAAMVARRIARTPPPRFHKQLITGHRGCGKSTELKQLQATLRDQHFFVVYLDTENVLDPADIEYLDVLLAIGRGVHEAIEVAGMRLPGALVQSLDAWFAETVLTEEQRCDVEATLQTQFRVEPNVPFLLRFLTALTGQIRAGGSRRTEVRQRLERETRVFLARLNELLDATQVELARKEWRGLVVIVDGLDKLPYQVLPDGQTSHSALFVHHAEQLKTPNCHVVYTVPVSLVFNVNLGDDFSDTEVMSMVKLTESDGISPCDEGQQGLHEVVARRVDVERVFSAPAALAELVRASGGVMRDLMRLVRFACDETDDQIAPEHCQHAIRRLAREYDAMLRDEDLELLGRIGRERRVSADERTARLLHLRLALEYRNHDRWADLHPAVRHTPRMRKLLQP